MLRLTELVSPTPEMQRKLLLMMPTHVTQVCTEESWPPPVLAVCPQFPGTSAFMHCDGRSSRQLHAQGWPIQVGEGLLLMSRG